MRLLPFLLVFPLILTGCGIFEADERREIGSLLGSHSFVVPESVAAGEPFEVRVITGGIPCDRKGRTVVELEGMTATITPYDFRATSGDCTLEPVSFDHSVNITFHQPGTAEVVLKTARNTSSSEIIEQSETVQVIGN